jgi:hypothetical protein
MEVKPKKCANVDCDNVFTPKYRTTERTCCYACEKAYQDSKPQKEQKHYKIPRVSKKRSKEEKIYTARRIVFLSKPENKLCRINGTNCTSLATTIEHSAGRGINYLNEETWKPACSNCNIELENNSELSKEHQVSKIHGGKKI